MKLTQKLKTEIDSFSYDELLNKWQTHPIGDPLFAGESGDYLCARMDQLQKDKKAK